MSTQLWRLLITLREKDSLTCSECFAILELLAEAATVDNDSSRFERLARQHLAKCPGCRDRIREQLFKLEFRAS